MAQQVCWDGEPFWGIVMCTLLDSFIPRVEDASLAAGSRMILSSLVSAPRTLWPLMNPLPRSSLNKSPHCIRRVLTGPVSSRSHTSIIHVYIRRLQNVCCAMLKFTFGRNMIRPKMQIACLHQEQVPQLRILLGAGDATRRCRTGKFY